VLRLFNRWLLSTPCQWVKSGKYIQTKYIYSGWGRVVFKIPDTPLGNFVLVFEQ
jgi:hypothetical protein